MPTVREAMDADPVTVRPDTDVETLVRTLRRHETRTPNGAEAKPRDRPASAHRTLSCPRATAPRLTFNRREASYI